MGKRAIALLLLFSFANDALGWWDISEHQLFKNVTDGLKKVYKRGLQPLEEMFWFEKFNSFMTIDDLFFEAKPMILLLGQYSTGKTTFIRYLLQSGFPGMEHISLEATTHSFIAVMYDEQERVAQGNVVVQDDTVPFRGLRQFGTMFTRHFKASYLPNPVLKSITFIDTPGVLDYYRGYDFAAVCSWFADRADMILLFFDVYKVDISDKFKGILNSIKRHHRKILVVLNKADQISTDELIRVYGGLMWNLGRVISTPERITVYIGSFWDNPYRNNESYALFDTSKDELFAEIQLLSKSRVMNKVDWMSERALQVRTHAHILCHLRNKMPSWTSWPLWRTSSQQEKQRELINNLDKEFEKIQEQSDYEHEFPDVKQMQKQLHKYNFMDFPTCSQHQFSALEGLLSQISQLLSKDVISDEIKGGAFKDGNKIKRKEVKKKNSEL